MVLYFHFSQYLLGFINRGRLWNLNPHQHNIFWIHLFPNMANVGVWKKPSRHNNYLFRSMKGLWIVDSIIILLEFISLQKWFSLLHRQDVISIFQFFIFAYGWKLYFHFRMEDISSMFLEICMSSKCQIMMPFSNAEILIDQYICGIWWNA